MDELILQPLWGEKAETHTWFGCNVVTYAWKKHQECNHLENFNPIFRLTAPRWCEPLYYLFAYLTQVPIFFVRPHMAQNGTKCFRPNPQKLDFRFFNFYTKMVIWIEKWVILWTFSQPDFTLKA